MENVEVTKIKSRSLILKADSISRARGFTQSQWSRLAGHAANGQTISRIISKGDCRVSTFLDLIDALGCELIIKENADE